MPCEKNYENDFVLHVRCNRNADVSETNENKIKMKRPSSVRKEQRKIGDGEGMKIKSESFILIGLRTLRQRDGQHGQRKC